MPFSQTSVFGLRACMGLFAGVSLVLGSILAIEGNASMALTNLCGALFFIFAYHNPDMLQSDGFLKEHISPEHVVQKKFLWTSLAVGIMALVWEFTSHLTLG